MDAILPDARRGEEHLPPVDTDIIADFLQHLLVFGRGQHDAKARHFRPGPDDLLVDKVHADLRPGGEVDTDLVRFLVRGSHRPGDVRHRPGDQLKIVRKQRRQKRQLDRDARAFELIDRPRGQHAQTDLREGGKFRRLMSDQAMRLAVDADQG